MIRIRMFTTVVALAAVLASGPGCYRYEWRGRGGPPAYNELPVDENNPHRSTRWSFVWGLLTDKWPTPTRCNSAGPDGKCLGEVPVCDNGVGRIKTSFSVGSGLLMLLTLGMAVPEHVTLYCSTAPTDTSRPPTDAPPPPPEGMR